MIEAQNLTKAYGPRVAVDRISFTIEKGEVVGFLGPNGAGKSTTMRILTGYIPATEGDARIAGFDVFDEPNEVKKRVGYLPESPPLYPELTVGAYLEFVAELRGFYGNERTRRVGRGLEQAGLVGWENRILGSLSKGYRQRAGLAQALLHDPEVLILDEPTSGLDPLQVQGIRTLMQDLASTRTVILSTHILSEVEAICPRALIIAQGKLQAAGTMAELRRKAPGGTWYYLEIAGADIREVGSLPGITHVEPMAAASPSTHSPEGGFQVLKVRAERDPRVSLFEAACARNWKIRDLDERLPTLEEAFIGIVNTATGAAR